MPELDILYGFEFATLQLKERWYRLHGVSLTASLQIFPRAFAVGTKKKNYVTCTVDDSARCDYQDNLEPMPEGFIPNKYDLQKSKGKAFERYLKQLKAGELFVKARGKEIVFAAGHHLVRAHFGLEGTMVIINTNDYNMMIANDCPGNNSNPGKASRMRSFIVPPHLTVPGARGSASDDRQQTMAIFAAVVGVEHTILLVDHNRLLRLHILSRAKPWTAEDLKPEAEVNISSVSLMILLTHTLSQIWPDLWSKNHGPDWTYETQHAEQVLDNCRQGVLAQGAASAQPTGVPESTLLDVMCSSQDVFNGYGQHTAHDLLHRVRLFPTTPPFYVCSSDVLFDRLKSTLSSYAKQYISTTYRERCLCQPNQLTPLFFNYTSNDNYLNQYLLVFRKSTLRMPRDEYNQFAKEGLFNRAHTIGDHYDVQPHELIKTNWKEVPVYQFSQAGKNPIYSVIVARRPATWRYAPEHVEERIAPDARDAGFSTTLGPASFHMFKENQYGWEGKAKPGRKAVVCF
ncbi:hypothetical protein PYCCODRAFT_1446678 [Trametes coccinea BRFM310]|uniref:Uncharacterized protein n=1 Tax=Trametes coccinea (strain BRFM310) TaxID=1353009 RepID=A0A1Y2IG90_TRAC3|nr:hypothetical protein PYCCODRAFT_1446678 [Trametes coccinea BRFM310]